MERLNGVYRLYMRCIAYICDVEKQKKKKKKKKNDRSLVDIRPKLVSDMLNVKANTPSKNDNIVFIFFPIKLALHYEQISP